MLSVSGLSVEIGQTKILHEVSLSVSVGQTLGVVGESGCGKTMTGLAIMGMLPLGANVTGGSIVLDSQDLTSLSERQWRKIRGKEIAMVMQDPFTSLNPVMRVGDQIAEVLEIHQGMSHYAAWNEAIKMLEKVGIKEPEQSARKFPHQMSGGQRQRVVIAIAFSCKPKLLVADEPTTALDVTIQAQILNLIELLQKEEGTAVILITHDIGVIGLASDQITVFYAGRIVESGPTAKVLSATIHPYTRALLGSIPKGDQRRIDTIGGQPPDMRHLESGCAFRPRCPQSSSQCESQPPIVKLSSDYQATCWQAVSAKK